MLIIEDANSDGSSGVPEMWVGTPWMGMPALQPCASSRFPKTFHKFFPAGRQRSGASVRRFHGNRNGRFLESEPLAVHSLYKLTANGPVFAWRAECAGQRHPGQTAGVRISVSLRRFAICAMVGDVERFARQRTSLRRR